MSNINVEEHYEELNDLSVDGFDSDDLSLEGGEDLFGDLSLDMDKDSIDLSDDVSVSTNSGLGFNNGDQEDENIDLFSDEIFDDSVELSPDDIFESDDQSDLEDETEKFISALTLTLKLRLNPMDAESDDKLYTRSYIKDISKSKMKDQINEMKKVLDIVQKYNQSDNRNTGILPKDIADSVVDKRLIPYNGKDNVVWKSVLRRIMSHAEFNQKLMNEIMHNVTDLKKKFEYLCESYEEEDKKFFDIKRSKPLIDIAEKKKFGFYYMYLNKLKNGNTVSLCRSMTFDKYDRLKYKFKCGSCGEDVFGLTEIELDNGYKVYEGDNHNFYQVLTVNGKGLHYPLICEKCGGINCLPAVIREKIDKNIDAPITESSNDKNEYVRKNSGLKNGDIGVDFRRPVPYEKWLDMLDYEIETGNFSINTESIFNNEDDFIAEVTDDDYRIAVESFRESNRTYNKKSIYDKNGIRDIDFILASISTKGRPTMLRDICELVSSYIIDTNTFRELRVLKSNKDDAFDYYLKIASIRNGLGSGDVSEVALSLIESSLKIKISESNIDSLYESAKQTYIEYRDDYDNCISNMCKYYKVFSYKRKDKKKDALKILCDVMGNDASCKKFILNVVSETLSTETYNNMRSSFSMHVGGKRIANMVNIRQSRVRDRNNMRKDRYEIMKSYISELRKLDNGVDKKNGERYKDIYNKVKEMIDKFDIDFHWYNMYCDWRDMFSLTDSTSVDELDNNVNRDSIYKEYNKVFSNSYRGDTFGLITDYRGRKLSDIKPDFVDSDYFKIILGLDDDITESIRKDAIRAITSIINVGNFQAYDIIFAKLMINFIGLQKFTGYDSSDVALKVNMTGGMTLKLYDECINDSERFTSQSRREYNTVRMLSEHDFVFKCNYSGNTEILLKYVDSVNNGDSSLVETDVIDELYQCMDRVKSEIGNIQYVKDELCFPRTI